MACAASLALASAQPALAQPGAVEAQVYGAALRNLTAGLKGEQVFVVAGDAVSLSDVYARHAPALGGVAEDLADRLAEASPKLREDILRRQAAPGPIAFPTRALAANVRLIVVPAAELSRFLPAGKPDEWPAFQAKYKARGVLELSRIGFDADGGTALVFVSERCPGLCGFGQYFLLRQQRPGTWEVVKTYLVWIS
jgi:hypothetical protein